MSYRKLIMACFGCLVLGLPTLARAGIMVAATPSNQDVQRGSSGFIDFSLITDSTIDLGAFNITVTVPMASGISFTGGSDSIANYVFASDPSGAFLFGNPIGMNSGDISDTPGGFNLNLLPGTYGLGRMFFSVATDAPLSILNVTLDGATSFTNGLTFAPFDYTPLGGATISTINVIAAGDPNVVPEPSTLLIAVILSMTAVGWDVFRRRPRIGFELTAEFFATHNSVLGEVK